ncbi:MAG TPA: N-acetylglucosamine-6-phosphate deacetylase [Bryobacteraceae bacterium]|jgi:N-acetylglucosamine-6-phosphate deacetylase
MNCSGIDVATGNPVSLEFDRLITKVEPCEAADGRYVAPGFIDIQVNGYFGVDYNNPATPHSEIARSIQALLKTGLTRFFPTVITGSPDNMLGAIRNLRQAKQKIDEGTVIEGIHVEGPYIGPEDGPRGAHPRQWVRPPDLDEWARWRDAAEGLIRLVTLSPHWPEAPRYIEALVADSVTVSIGHTMASTEQLDDAVRAGATLSTHLGNGAHQILRRHPNYIWDQMADDRLNADFIVDGIHLQSAFLKVALRAKTVERSILVTDASAPAGAAVGRYQLGEQAVDHTADGRVVLAGTDKLAGSALRMDHGVENLMRLAGISLRDSIQLATTNPARVTNIPKRQTGLAPGERADVIVFGYNQETGKIAIEQTYVDGVKMWAAN